MYKNKENMSFIKQILFIIILSFTGLLYAQERPGKSGPGLNTDSLFNSFLQMRKYNNLPDAPYAPVIPDRKCGFETVAQVFFNRNRFTPEQQSLLKVLMARPITSTSILSPSGFFRVHYDENGYNKPGYNAIDLAIALDSSYRVEVDRMGFPPPPSDNGAGGDDKYDVYIQALGGTYGYTWPENEITPGTNTYTSYIVINNDFTGFYTTGINAARVTAAHELHHAIQTGNYIYKEINGDIEDLFFYELTSTSMEEFVFDDVNDYHGYMKSFFTYPDKPLQFQSGYNLAIWNIFLKERVGESVFVKQWEQFKTKRALTAIDISLNSLNTSFYDEFKEFAVWTYFTNYRAIPNKYFKDAKDFPMTLKPLITAQLQSPYSELKVNDSKPTSINYLRFYRKDGTYNDTIAALIVNSDIQKGIIQSGSVVPAIPFTYTLSASALSGFYTVMEGSYYAKFASSDDLFFSNNEVVNDVLAGSGNIIRKGVEYVYPSPFRYSQHTYLNFTLPAAAEGYCDISIYDIKMKLVYSGKEAVKNNIGMRTLQWSGLDANKEKVGSGVYIYAIKAAGETYTGKIVIIND